MHVTEPLVGPLDGHKRTPILHAGRRLTRLFFARLLLFDSHRRAKNEKSDLPRLNLTARLKHHSVIVDGHEHA